MVGTVGRLAEHAHSPPLSVSWRPQQVLAGEKTMEPWEYELPKQDNYKEPLALVYARPCSPSAKAHFILLLNHIPRVRLTYKDRPPLVLSHPTHFYLPLSLSLSFPLHSNSIFSTSGDMSRSRSASLEIVPPATSSVRGLADVMDAVFKKNHKDVDDDNDDADADAEVDEIDEQAPATKAPAAANPPTAPVPCERCERTHKQCKGLPGARCEYCKRLKQKCSNSSGPARGKNASVKKPADSKAIPKGTANKATAGPSVVPQPSTSLKRKLPAKIGTSHNGDAENYSLDGEGSIVEEEGHEPPPRLNKKRRISKGNGGPTRSQLVKAVADIEGSVKRIQASVAKEVEKMNAVIKTLNTKISEMDEE